MHFWNVSIFLFYILLIWNYLFTFGIRKIVDFIAINAKQHTGSVIMQVQFRTCFTRKLFFSFVLKWFWTNWGSNPLKVIVVPKIRFLEKKFFYELAKNNTFNNAFCKRTFLYHRRLPNFGNKQKIFKYT